MLPGSVAYKEGSATWKCSLQGGKCYLEVLPTRREVLPGSVTYKERSATWKCCLQGVKCYLEVLPTRSEVLPVRCKAGAVVESADAKQGDEGAAIHPRIHQVLFAL